MSRGRKIKIEIKESLEEIKKLYRKESDGETKIRLLAIIHLKEGKNGSEISKLLKIKQRTLYNWIKFYKEEGIGRLKTQKASGRPAKLSEEKKEEIQNLVRAKKFSSLEEFNNEITNKYKVNYSISGLWRRTKKLELAWKNGRKHHYKANIEAQETFKKKD